MPGLEQLSERVYRFPDACNVYVVVAGAKALLIDLGTGAVLDELRASGMPAVDLVLMTHHHRDQAAGCHRLSGEGIELGVSDQVAHWFEDADGTWQRQQILDLYDCTNLFDRPLADVPVDRRLRDYERLTWEDLSIEVLPTPGHTKGSVTYLVELEDELWAFSGDLAYADGRLWRLHDLHWDYSEPDALDAQLHSVQTLRGREPSRVAPSHGPVIDEPAVALGELEQRVRRLIGVAGRQFVGDFRPPLAGDVAIERVTEHLLSVNQACANFYVLLGPGGRALFFDYGFPGFLGHIASGALRFVEHSLAELQRDFGVRSVDVVVATHYHDDHVAGFGYLKERFGTEVWALDVFADVLERPWAYRLPAVWSEPVEVDRRFAAGETIEWEGHSFETRHLPGHTWYAGGLFGQVDGRRVAIIGDEIQLDGDGVLRGGGPVYRNRFRIDSFRRGIDAVRAFEPEVLLTGHDGAIDVDRASLDGVREWAVELEEALVALVPDDLPVGLALDPAFAAFHPYQLRPRAGEPFEAAVEVVNHGDEPAEAHVRLVLPPGWQAAPEDASVTVASGETSSVRFTVAADEAADRARRHLLAADVTLDGARFVQACEGIVEFDRPDRPDRSI